MTKHKADRYVQKLTSTLETQFTQRVVTSVKDDFLKETMGPDVPLNLHFGVGKQLTAAMFTWVNLVPREMRLTVLGWALDLGKPFDPIVGQRIQAALSRAILEQGPVLSDPPGTAGKGK